MVQWSVPLTYWTAIELFFDGTNHTVDENSELHDCVGVIIGGVQHTDGPLQVKYWGGPDTCDPCGVDAYELADRNPLETP